jgi:pyrimidine deaminase RibD-like protein
MSYSKLKTSTGTTFKVKCVIVDHTDLIANEDLANFIIDHLEHYAYDTMTQRYYIPQTEPLSTILLIKFPFLIIREVAYVIQ